MRDEDTFQGRTVVFIFLFSLALRLLAALIQPYNLDEGSYLLESRLILEGRIPFRDFVSREPIFILLVTLFSLLPGPPHVMGRMLAVVSSALTSLLVYILGSRLYCHRLGVAAMVLHAVTPYFVYSGSILKLEPVAQMFAAGSLALAVGAGGSNLATPLFAGAVAGLAVHVRRSAVVLLLIVALAVYVRSRSCRAALWCLLAGLIAAAIPLVVIVAVTDLRWVWLIYGPGQGVYAPGQPLDSLLAVARTSILLLTPHLPLAVAFLLFQLRHRVKEQILIGVLSIALQLMALLLGAGLMSRAYGYGTLWVPSWQQSLGVVAFALAGAAVLMKFNLGFPREPDDFQVSDAVLGAWLLAMSVFYLAYVHFFVDYLADFSGVVSLCAARAWLSIGAPSEPRDRTGMLSAALLAVVVFLPWLYVTPVLNPYNWPVKSGLPEFNLYERTFSRDTVQRVAEALRLVCPRNRPILTADPLFAVAAKREVFRNLTYPIHYFQERDPPFSYDPFRLVPGKVELTLQAAEEEVYCLLVGPRTREFLNWAPSLHRLLLLAYEPRLEFGQRGSVTSVRLYTLKSGWRTRDSRGMLRSTMAPTPVRGQWVVGLPRIEATGGSPLRAIATYPIDVGRGVRISASVTVQGEGGFVVGYRAPSDYLGVRIIRSRDITGLNVFLVTESDEVPLADYPTPRLVGRPVTLTVYAFPSFIQVFADGRHLVSSTPPREVRGRVGLLANYGASFSWVDVRNDWRSLLGQ